MGKKIKKEISLADMMQEALHEPLDAREILAPYVGDEVIVSGYIEELSRTKGKYPKPSALLTKVKVFVSDGMLVLDYLWIVSDRFSAGQAYVFAADVIEYTTYDSERNATANYGLGNMRRLVKHDGDVKSAMKVVVGKEDIDAQTEENGSPDGVIIIEEIFKMYGISIISNIIEGGKWQCSISRPGSDDKITISTEDTFASASAKAGDIVTFLCEPKGQE